MVIREKLSRVFVVVATLTSAGYLLAVFVDAPEPITDVPYVWPMLAAAGSTCLLTLLGTVVAVFVDRSKPVRVDERDQSIAHHGNLVGYAGLAVGTLVALAAAMAGAHPFWIANTLYLALMASAVADNVAKLISYRRGGPPW
jgi:hypothetical protein